MVQDDDFEPRLGRIRSLGGRHGRKYLHRVLQATNLAKGSSGSSRTSRFSGSRIGRGAGIGRVLAARDRYAAYRRRRVVIKSRIVKLAGKGLQGARAHLRYIQRDGVTRDGRLGQLYDAAHDQADGRTFLDRAEGDRHQFRFIVSTEDGAQYEDLKPLVRRLMARMEEDLGTRLDWVAVDHYNTGHPHSHVILRGRDDRGRDLIIARNYITTGMRERAAEIVGLDFGPRSDLEIEDRLRQEVEQERLTSLDRALLRDAGSNGLVGAADADAFRQSLRAGRLRKLERLGLAEEIRPGHWQLAEGLEDILRRMGERGDIIKTMHRAMIERGMARAATECVIDDPAQARPIVGRVVARGLSDEINDRHYLIVDGIDGYSHYVDIGAGQSVEPLPEGAIVRVEPRPIEPRQVDRTVAEIAAAHDGRYSVDIHLRHDPTASQDFAETHVRRLEAMRKLTGAVTREPDGTWIIAPDHLERVAEFERRQVRDRPVVVTPLSSLPLERQVTADGATWLDRELLSVTPELLRDAGFGREVRDALAQRRQWLIAENLAHQDHERVVFRAGLLDTLRRRELARVAGQLSGELGLAYVEAGKGERIEGIYRRALDLASGRYGLIEKSREFTLVPWRPVLERHLGRQVSGIVRGDGISWTIGRQRGGPGVG
jgi:Type IV secretory pathway, VirD2 components (relaxase)